MPKAKKIRLGIIGGGDWSDYVHFPAIQECRKHPPAGIEVEIAGIWNIDAEVAARYARSQEFGRAYPSLESLAADPTIDGLILIVAPVALAEVVRKLIPSRKPIFTEKPPGVTVAEAEELAESVRTLNLVAFNRRYSPLNVAYKDLLEDRPQFVECEFYRFNRLEPRFLGDTGIHLVNYLDFLFGDICDVETLAVTKNSSQAIHLSNVRWKDGLTGQMRFIQNTGAPHERITAHGAGWSLSLYSSLQGSADYPGCILRRADGQCEELHKGDATAPHYVNLGVLAEYEEYLTAIAFGGTVRSTFQTSVNSMRVCERLGSNAPLPSPSTEAPQ